MLHHYLPNFEAALPRLVANREVSFSTPFVPQPLHRGVAPGADWVLGGAIFGQILAASIILFLPGCFIKEEVLGTSIKNSDSYLTENTILSFLSSYPIASDKLYFQIIFIRITNYQSSLNWRSNLKWSETCSNTESFQPGHIYAMKETLDAAPINGRKTFLWTFVWKRPSFTFLILQRNNV